MTERIGCTAAHAARHAGAYVLTERSKRTAARQTSGRATRTDAGRCHLTVRHVHLVGGTATGCAELNVMGDRAGGLEEAFEARSCALTVVCESV